MAHLGKCSTFIDLWSKCLPKNLARQHNICFCSLLLFRDKIQLQQEAETKDFRLYTDFKRLDGVKEHPDKSFIYLCTEKSDLSYRKRL